MKKINRLPKSLGMGLKGFTLVELLVVLAILGVLAAVAVPAVASFIHEGDTQALDVELKDIQTAVVALMADSSAGVLDAGSISVDASGATNDISDFTADDGTLFASNYMTGLNDDNTTKTGAYYWIDASGKVHQVSILPTT